jgi:hypothetical protein
VAALLAATAFLPLTARAGLFDDDEARKAILDIRSKIEALQRDVANKADKNSVLTPRTATTTCNPRLRRCAARSKC